MLHCGCVSEPSFHQWTCLASPIVSREIINGCGFKPLSPWLFHSNGSLIHSTSYFETIFENPFPPVTLLFLLAVCYNFAKTMQKMANGLFSRMTSCVPPAICWVEGQPFHLLFVLNSSYQVPQEVKETYFTTFWRAFGKEYFGRI